MDDLIAWLQRCYHEDERIARRALAEQLPTVESPMSTGHAYMAVWAPDRVLVDLALKQRILQLHRQPQHRRDGVYGGACVSCANEAWPCLTLRLLTLPYVDRPGYRDEWRP